MPSSDEIARQKRAADEQKRRMEQLAAQQKDLARKRITDINQQMSSLREEKRQLESEIGKLAA